MLPSLAELDLRNNKLAALPPALGESGTLGELRLGFNKISSVPPSLGMLRSLKTLDLRNNVIEVCAAELRRASEYVVGVCACHTHRSCKEACRQNTSQLHLLLFVQARASLCAGPAGAA